MAIKPVLHRIIVKQDSIEDKDEYYKAAKAAGILIHKDEQSREQLAVDTGTVVSIGATAFKDFGADCPIVVGDTVVYARYAGKVIEDAGVKYVALNDEDIVAIITTEGA